MERLKRIIAMSLALALVLSMSGCYWKGKTKYQSEQIILDALEERYGEEFFIRQMAVRSSYPGRPLAAYCSPKDDKEIVFEVQYQEYEYDDPQLDDTYIPMIVRREMKSIIDTELAKHYDNFAVEVEVANLARGNQSGIFNADDASIVSYSEAIPEDSVVSVFIALHEEDFDDYSEIQDVLVECVKDFHLSKASIECYFADTSIIEKCNEVINNDNYDDLEIMLVLSPGKCITDKQYELYVYYYNGPKFQLHFLKSIDENGTHIPLETDVITVRR